MIDPFSRHCSEKVIFIPQITPITCFYTVVPSTKDAGRVVLGGGYAGISPANGKLRPRIDSGV